jgi:hypothetical protein
MDEVKRKTTTVGIVTLIVGLAVGLSIGVWGIKASSAGNAPSRISTTTSSNSNRNNTVDQNDSSLAKNDWDHWDPFRDMERMHEEIDRAIRDATERFSFAPGATVFQPDASVNVKIDNDQTLRVSVKQQKQQTKNTNGSSASITQLGRYEQVVTLPEPVRSQDMKIDRHGHEIVITIPKANK